MAEIFGTVTCPHCRNPLEVRSDESEESQGRQVAVVYQTPRNRFDRVHALKILPKNLSDLLTEGKSCEVRVDDRGGYEADDVLRLQEWSSEDGYTGTEVYALVRHVLRAEDCPEQFAAVFAAANVVVMSVEVIRGPRGWFAEEVSDG
jgi:hypothetical protein